MESEGFAFPFQVPWLREPIFVPSIGGISHSPKELTRWPDCENGANVLLHTILQVDRDMAMDKKTRS
jgi:Acetylornithine deacetylase/Succinyl-diaminopimelate desuccinylase and related deacylases